MYRTKAKTRVIIILLILTFIAIYGCNEVKEKQDSGSSVTQLAGLVQKIQKTREIHAAYGDYPPYSMEDIRSGKINGFSVEIMNRIASALNCKIKWYKTNWDTMSADLKRGQYDVIVSPIFQTIPRATEFSFSRPYLYFADGIAVVRIDDKRFNKFEDLNKEGITISVGMGQASEALARARLKKATIKPVIVGTDNMLIFNEVLSGRVDVALADLPNALRFVNEHKNQVRALWVDNPPAFMPAGFAFRPDDQRSADFINVCIMYLKTTGMLSDIAKKYGIKKHQLRQINE